MAPESYNPDKFEDSHDPEEPREAGEFTRAFGGGEGKPKPDHPLSSDSPSSQAVSVTQILRGSSEQPQAAAEKPLQSVRPLPNSAAFPTTDSFTTAFEGVNAFTRNLGDIREDPFKTELGKQSRFDAASSAASGTFTRIFGARERVVTPARPEGNNFEKASALPKPTIVKEIDFSQPPSPAPSEPGSFTEAFRTRTPPEPQRKAGSFTEQFELSSPSWPAQESPLPSVPPRVHPPVPADPFRAHQDQPPPLASSQRPATPDGGFTRLVGSHGTDAGPLPDETSPLSPAPRVPQHPSPDPTFASPGSSSSLSVPGATVVFNPSRPEPEFSAAQAKSEYTMVMEASKFRASSDRLAAGSSPAATSSSATPSGAVPYPPLPQPPAWPPAPASPTPPVWGPPPVATPPMPTMAAPQLAVPSKIPTTGERLVQFLPLILTLSVINFLGLLAALIILFATRR